MLYQGDARLVLQRLSWDKNHRKKYRAIITSPPYFGHRVYGDSDEEVGRESTDERYLESLAVIFRKCLPLLADDGSLWIVIGDARKDGRKLRIPNRLAEYLEKGGYVFKDEIVWQKGNNLPNGSKNNFTPAYESVLFLSKSKNCFTDMDAIRVLGNEVLSGKTKPIPPDRIQTEPFTRDDEKIRKIKKIIRSAKPETSFDALPSTSEIALAFGFDPEKHCPACLRKWKRHATRKRIGGHRHYPIFARCNPKGKNPGNVWKIATKAHYGNEHFAIFPEELVERIVKFSTKAGDLVLDPFMGRGTTGIVCRLLNRHFTGIDLYAENVKTARANIAKA